MKDLNILQKGVLTLAKKDHNIKNIIDKYGFPNDKPLNGGFRTLLRMILGQQISVKVADSIWSKIESLRPINEKNILNLPDKTLNDIGLSRQKISYAKDLANKIISKDLVLNDLKKLSSDKAHNKLISVKGIGDWTAEIYRLFVLCDLNSFPKGDIAVQEGARIYFNLKDRPKPNELIELVKFWKPLQGAGALVMWQIYRLEVREGISSNFYE
tara:strand:+ start:461 stop:1099 length:639 start_codon:yes stop_codon:yes gene_type:complete